MENMSDPLIPPIFTMTDEFKEKILEKAAEFPQAFVISPAGEIPEPRCKPWAKYNFDGVVELYIDTSHDEAINLYKQKFEDEKEIKMTKALTVKEKDSVKALLANNIKAIQSVLPKHLTPEKMLRMVYTAVILTPKLARCSQLSLLNAVIESSAIGLEIGGPLAEAHLLPYKNEVKLIPDYKGLIKLAYQSSIVAAFTARPVYKNDQFDYRYGLNDDLVHVPFKGGDRGELVAAYALVKLTTGGVDFEVVEHDDAMAAKACSPAKNSEFSPWNKKADEWTMWVKTAVKKLLKRVPLSPDLRRALDLDAKPEEEQKFGHIIEADFKPVELAQETENEAPVLENKAEPLSDEDQKIVRNFQVTMDSFPDEYAQAIKEHGFNEGDIVPVKDMDKVMKTIGSILDGNAIED